MQHYRICCLVYVHLKLYIHIVAFITAYWHCSHTMWKGLCNSMMSIHLSVCLFHPSATAAACGGFTARHLAGRQYWPSHHLATASYGSKDLGTRPRTWPSRPRTWPSRPRTWPSRPRFDLRRRVAQTTAHTHTHTPRLTALCLGLPGEPVPERNKKLSYRQVTARCVLSVVILPVTTQQYRNYLYDKSWPNRWYEVGSLVGGNVS